MKKRSLLIVAVIMTAALIGAVLAFTPAGKALRGRNGDAIATMGDPTPANIPPPAGDHAMPATPARGEVVIDPRRQQLIGVRVVPVRRTSIGREVRAAGVVRFDETRQAEITTKVDGWIRDLRADYTGRTISRGEPLFTLYSPGLLAAQNEYLLAVRGHANAASSELPSVRDYSERLHQAARERLLRWDLSEGDIGELEQRGRAADTVTFRSPVSGTIVEKMAVEGMRVTTGQTLFRVADLSVVWVEADVPEQDVSIVRVGQTARVTLQGFPDEPLLGRTIYVYPTVEEQTRTAKVRVEFANRGGRLRPGMFAEVLLGAPDVQALTVPTDAVLEAGTDQLVFVARGEGRFEPRPVKVGRRTRNAVEIASGLTEGEQVAAGAAFFLDSESQLRAAVQSYQAPPDRPAATSSERRLDITFRSQPDPPRTGENTFDVVVRDASGQPIADAEVSVTFFMAAMPTMNMPAMRNQTKLPAAGNGVYRGSGQVMTPGRWDVTVDVSRGGQRLGSRQFAVTAK
jgi:Cu(I)/Ag(I) efflux system membrane fusion protein/cobalt-zinc-cadmium efflux system membrane fusion protein